jgi:hypothetical protein
MRTILKSVLSNNNAIYMLFITRILLYEWYLNMRLFYEIVDYSKVVIFQAIYRNGKNGQSDPSALPLTPFLLNSLFQSGWNIIRTSKFDNFASGCRSMPSNDASTLCTSTISER